MDLCLSLASPFLLPRITKAEEVFSALFCAYSFATQFQYGVPFVHLIS